MHVLSIGFVVVMALVKGMALRGVGSSAFVTKLTSRLSVAALPPMARPYGSSKKVNPSSNRVKDRRVHRSIPPPKAAVVERKAPVGASPIPTPVTPSPSPSPSETEARTVPEKNRKGPEILEKFPDGLLPKEFAPWSGTAADFQRLIVHEDDAILVVFKPAGVMAQPDDDEKVAGATDAGFGGAASSSSSNPTEPPSRIVVRNNRYFYPDIDILTLAKEYLQLQIKKAAAGYTKPKRRPSKYLEGYDDEGNGDDTDDELQRQLNSVFVGLVHRLDRPASGLMILAKTPDALKNLNQQFADQVVIKRYVCMVNGKVDQPDVCIDYLLKTSGDVAKVVRNPFRKAAATTTTNSSSSGSSSSSSSSSSSTKDSSATPTASPAIFTIDDLLAGRTNENEDKDHDTTTSANDPTSPRLRSDVVRAELSYTPLHVVEHTVRKKWSNLVDAKTTRGGDTRRSSRTMATATANVTPGSEEVVKVMADGYVETKTYQTLLNVTLLTGRKHQIRTQLSHRQHPIVGDQKYLAPQAFGERDISLHAYYLGFFHPTTRARAAFRLDVPRIWEKRFGRETWKAIVPLVARPVHSKAAAAATATAAAAKAAAEGTTEVDPSSTAATTAAAAAASAATPATEATAAPPVTTTNTTAGSS